MNCYPKKGLYDIFKKMYCQILVIYNDNKDSLDTQKVLITEKALITLSKLQILLNLLK